MSSTNEIRVLFFAALRDAAGQRDVVLPWTGGSVRDLRQVLLQRFPALEASLASALVSVNRVYAFDDEAIPPGAEVALFPPVSGG